MIFEFSMNENDFEIQVVVADWFRIDAKNHSFLFGCYFLFDEGKERFVNAEVERWEKQCEDFERSFPGVLKEAAEIVKRSRKIGSFQ